jgi:hypothetical protein
VLISPSITPICVFLHKIMQTIAQLIFFFRPLLQCSGRKFYVLLQQKYK